MLLAVSACQDRIPPVLDVARQFLIVELEQGRETQRFEMRLPDDEPLARARALSYVGPQVLICGAASRAFEAALVSSGVQVLANICGPVDEVVAAFAAGRLPEGAFRMLNCPRRRLRRPRRANEADRAAMRSATPSATIDLDEGDHVQRTQG